MDMDKYIQIMRTCLHIYTLAGLFMRVSVGISYILVALFMRISRSLYARISRSLSAY